MARRRRKMRSLRGLGGSPEHHAAKSASFFNKAITAFEDGERAAKSGDCFGAHDAIVVAALRMGRAEAHMEEAGSAAGSRDKALYSSAHDAEDGADKAYYKACVKPSSGLGAMRRRRSRR